MSYNHLPDSTVSTQMSTSPNISLLSNFYSFPVYFQGFQYVLVFSGFTMMCRNSVCRCVCVLILLWDCCAFWISVSYLWSVLENFSTIIFSNTAYSSLSLSFQESWNAYLLIHLTVSHMFLTLFIQLTLYIVVWVFTSELQYQFHLVCFYCPFFSSLATFYYLFLYLLNFRKSQSTSSLSLFSLHGAFRSTISFSSVLLTTCLSHSWEPKFSPWAF